MNTRHLLLTRILQDQSDDAVRLAYADHIDEFPVERSDPIRSELIRRQIELSRLDVKRREETQDEWESLLRCNNLVGELVRLEGATEAPHSVGDAPYFKTRLGAAGEIHVEYEAREGAGMNPSITYARGFISALSIPRKPFEDNLYGLFRHHPIETVVPSDCRPMPFRYLRPGPRRFVWYACSFTSHSSHHLGSGIGRYIQLYESDRRITDYKYLYGWDTEVDALAAVDRALVMYARDRVQEEDTVRARK